MDQNYIAPASALKKLKEARNLSQTVYLYGATGYSKTELVRQYLSGRRYTYLSCEELPWEAGALPRLEPGRQTRRVVVIDDLHRLKSEELRREIIALEERADIWLILISRSPVPTWLMPQHIKSVFVVIQESDLRMGREEITGYLDACGIAYTEENIQYLLDNAQGNAYILHHAALRMKEGSPPGPELRTEIRGAFAAYLENVVLVHWDSDLLCDRRIVSFVLRDANDSALVYETLDQALAANPDAHPLFHSDRGFQYTTRVFHDKLAAAGMTQSMSRVGKCIDNGPMEGFWGILKRERYYGRRFTSREQLCGMIREYIAYYNFSRLQRRLGVHTPMEVYTQCRAA